MDKRQQIIDGLRSFAEQRPGMEPMNYGNWRNYRNESASVTRDLHDARRLIREVELSSIGHDALREAFRAYSGRLSLSDRPDGSIALEYCTGQYFPTEFRRAVCAVCAAALWDHYREDFAASARNGESPGDAIRRNFRQLYGRRIAARWFH